MAPLLLRGAAMAALALLLAACATTENPAAERFSQAQPSVAALPALPLGRDPPPERLYGLAAAELRAQLGPPSLARRERPAEVWQYRRSDCVLDVFLYPRSDRLEVVHLEARDNTAAPVALSGCLKGLDATSNPPT